MNKLNIFSKAAAILCIGAMVSCEDTNLEDLLSDQDAETSENYIKTEAALSNLYSIVDRALRDSTFQATDSARVDGAMVWRDGSLVTIDHGNGVIGTDGRTRKGAIQITETGGYMTTNASLAVALSNYSVDAKNVVGTMSLTKIANNFELKIDSFSAGENVEINADKAVSWTNGFTTLTKTDDDVFQFSGTASGTELNNNRELSSSITEAMVYDRSCSYKMTEGVLELVLAATDSTDELGAAIDFIDSDGCNNLVKLTLSQGESDIELTKQFDGF